MLGVPRAPGPGAGADRRPAAAAPALAAGERLEFAGGLGATVLGRHEEAAPLVWLAFDLASERLAEALHRAGRPVRYAYVPRPGRCTSTRRCSRPARVGRDGQRRPAVHRPDAAGLRDRGVGLATISLHAGLSTYGDPATDRRYVPAEPYLIPPATVAAVAACRAAGGRVVAVGTWSGPWRPPPAQPRATRLRAQAPGGGA